MDTRALLSSANESILLRDYDRAERQVRAAMERDPLDVIISIRLATIYFNTGRFAEAEGIVRSAIERQPDSEWNRAFLARILLLQGKVDAARAELKLEPHEGARIATLPLILHAAGRTSEADAALKAQIEYWADEWAQGIAMTYAYMGDHDRAMEWLERAYQQRDTSLYDVDSPIFRDLRNDPRYKSFLRNRLKLPV